jgi:phage tail sheath protein FI
VPDLVTAATTNGDIDLDLFKSVQTTLIDQCELSGRMAILDAPPGMRPQQIKEWRSDVAMYDAKYAALYYPWLEVANPNPSAANGDRTLHVPPSGHVAGIWARNDNARGVWKAPANEVVRGALDVDFKVTSGEQELLNPVGINCIRPFGTRGIRVWGARTLSSDPAWRYVNVRRLFNFIEESILRGTQWIVFEPNDLDLWQRVKRTITAFLIGMWRQGALLGATPEQAFYVKCDEETNPTASIDEGKLVVEIGIAPVKPAEFVIFRISQWQGGADTTE